MRMHRKLRRANTRGTGLAAAAAGLLLAGCASSLPYAELDGYGSSPAQANEADVRIVGTDGKLDPAGSRSVTVEPGSHYFLIATTRAGRRGPVETRGLPLKMKPCTRYLLAAHHPHSISTRDWEVLVKAEEPIPGCAISQAAHLQ